MVTPKTENGLNHLLQKNDALPFILSVGLYDQDDNLVSYHQKKGNGETERLRERGIEGALVRRFES